MWGEVGGGVPATRLPSLSERPHGSPLSHTRVQSSPRSVKKCTFAPRSNLERESLARRRLRSSVVAWNLNWDPKTCTGNRQISFFLKKEKIPLKKNCMHSKRLLDYYV